MKILKNILTLLLVVLTTAFLAVSSFTFSQEKEYTSDISAFAFMRTTAKIMKTELGKSFIDKKEYLGNDPLVLDKWMAGHIEFGKLASAFILSNKSGSLDFDDFVFSGATLTVNPEYPTVFSLYDPFTVYSVASLYRDFLVTQVTNGSFYIGRDDDGTYSLYSVDAVIRLDFLDNGAHMSDMVLFPGMYIRFDPKMNKILKGANLFRILQSLESDGTQDESNSTTWIEFVNPRMDTAENVDSFFMYKLPVRTNILFQMLHVLFYDRVSQIDLYKEYGASAYAYTNNTTRDEWLVNPGKKSHFLLLGLDTVLASALQNTVSLESIRTQISDISDSADTLAVGNDVEARLERFLTDGRFALFGGTKNEQFAEIYTAISETVGKAPRTAHALLLQRLSDIYSKNLVAQKKDLAFSRIDTYSPTALELKNTLESTDIEQRDYFDIALYAFNVLKKAEGDGWLFIDEAIYAHPTYALIETILVATDRYVNSIEDAERKNITYEGITLYFYDHMLNILARSVYHTFMENEDGYLYLKPTFRPTTNEPKIHMNQSLIQDFITLDGRLALVSERLDAQYGPDSENRVFRSIKKSITTFHSFARLLDYESYSEYIKLPYISDQASDIAFPMYGSGRSILSSNPTEQVEVNGRTIAADPAIDMVIAILGDIPRTDILKEGDIYRIEDAMVQFAVPSTGSAGTIGVQLDILFDKSISSFSSLSLVYKWHNIALLTDKKTVTDLRLILKKIPEYVQRLDEILAGNPSLDGDIRFLETSEKIVVGIYPFPLVP
jgi:hypothetical protein